jgi:hypothetical protein
MEHLTDLRIAMTKQEPARSMVKYESQHLGEMTFVANEFLGKRGNYYNSGNFGE